MAPQQPVSRKLILFQMLCGAIVAVVGVTNLFSDSFEGWWRLLAVAQVTIGALWFAASLRQLLRARSTGGPRT
ncbi:hypothetical protein [Kytococcus sedentarius]|uniref:hypothetical protein n=1 Tax=Kytococcus sedentarius TaxID=1276 RepID=UPI0035BC077B